MGGDVNEEDEDEDVAALFLGCVASSAHADVPRCWFGANSRMRPLSFTEDVMPLTTVPFLLKFHAPHV